MGPPGRCSREFGMKWRVMLELVGPDGIVCAHEVGGRAAVAEYAPQMIGLTLEEGKHLLAALQVHLVQAQAEDHSRRRRRCQRCGAQRPLKDQRSRRLVSLFGTVEVRAPRFTPCRCAVTCRRTLNPVAEIMPDRCTPEHERTVAKMGSLLPYRRARTLLAEFLPLGKPQAVETTRSESNPFDFRAPHARAVSLPCIRESHLRPIGRSQAGFSLSCLSSFRGPPHFVQQSFAPDFRP